jgi:hypothetical protein
MKYNNLLGAQNTLTNYGAVSFHKTQKQLTSLNRRCSLTEVRVLCAIAWERGKSAHQSHGLILIQWNQSRKIKIIALKWMITERSKSCKS